jgi:hypothetical protein
MSKSRAPTHDLRSLHLTVAVALLLSIDIRLVLAQWCGTPSSSKSCIPSSTGHLVDYNAANLPSGVTDFGDPTSPTCSPSNLYGCLHAMELTAEQTGYSVQSTDTGNG